MPKEFTLPDLGEGITEAQIVRVMISVGDQIAEDQYLMEVETDKAAVEIPSPYAGVASAVHVKEGQTVNVGDVIVTFDQSDEDATKSAKQSAPTATKSAATTAPPAATPARQPAPVVATRTSTPAAPAVRKLARQLGVNLDSITGTGPGGRVTKEDVERHAGGTDGALTTVASPSGPPPTRTPTATGELPAGSDSTDTWGAVRTVALNQIRKTIAKQMSKSAFTAVHVTHGDEADITELDRMRRALNEATGNDPKLTVTTFVIRAVCIALRKYPIFNASFDDQKGEIVYKKYINMGIAVDAQRGLIVPVVRNADQLTMRGIAHELRTIADRIRTNRFAIEDLRGGTFTITNVGALGGTFSTPIINHPEVAILGIGRAKKVPVLRDGNLAEAQMLPLNLSFDHRATDGANAARFTSEIKSYLETPAKFLLD